jgi:hypothetical protein
VKRCEHCGHEAKVIYPGPGVMLGVGGPVRLLNDEDEAVHLAARLEYYGRLDAPPVTFPQLCKSCSEAAFAAKRRGQPPEVTE